MVIARRINERRDKAILEEGLEKGREEGLEKGLEKGREEGRVEADGEWTAWLTRSEEAQREGREFTEPPPSKRAESDK